MAFNKFTEDIAYVSRMDNEPSSGAGGWTAAQVKAQFDKAGLELQNFINLLIDALAGKTAAANIGADAVKGIAAGSVQSMLAALADSIEGIAMGGVPDGSISEQKLADGSVREGKIGAAAVSESKLRDGAVTAGKLADGSVTRDKIADGAVNADKLAPYCIGQGQLAAAAVYTSRIQDEAVVNSKIAKGTITADRLQDKAITTDKIANGAVSGAKLDLNSGELPWVKLAYGVHYFNQGDTLPTATAGRIIFVKR